MSLGLGFSGGGGSLSKAQSAKIKAISNNYRGVWKPQGCQTQVIEGYFTDFTNMKIETEGPFSRVRIWVFTRGAYGEGYWKFAVAGTESIDFDTVSNAYYPISGGVANNNYQTTATTYGWVRATWGGIGKAHGGYQSSNAMQYGDTRSGKVYPSYDYPQAWEQSRTDQALGDVICSDWIQCRSITPATLPASGQARPQLLIKCSRDTGAFPIMGRSGYNNTQDIMLTVYTDWISGDNQYRMRYGKQYTGGDGVDDLSYKPSTAGVPTGSSGSQHLPYIAVEIEYDNPTRSFARFGDSNTEGYGWFDSQTNNLSTPTKPITCANFGMSSNRSIQYFTVADAVIKKGMAFTDWVIPSHSHNDSNGTDFDLDQTKVQILKVLDEADSLGVQVWIWTHWLGTTTGSPASDPEIETYLTWIRSICAQGRANLVDIAANWISATYSSDGNVHPNAAGIAYNKTVVNSALRRYL